MMDNSGTVALSIDSSVRAIIGLALAEDRVEYDITSRAAIPAGLVGEAVLMAKEEGILCGAPVFQEVCRQIDAGLRLAWNSADGRRVRPGEIVASLSGPARSLLAAERTALNFLCHLSGIASATADYVARVNGTKVQITDTRKTMPGMRRLEKYAVRCGGGRNHRADLSDGVLIKDNHLAVLSKTGLGLEQIVRNTRQTVGADTLIEVEVTSLAGAREVIAGGADIVLLDNMSIAEMAATVKALGGRAIFEASGGIKLDNVRAVAASGVDRISIGALTHSARALDFSLEMATG